MQIHVIFRACDKVLTVNGGRRPFGCDKPTLIRVCFSSLMESLHPVAHTVHVLGDRLSDEMMEFFTRYPVTLSNGALGNDGSIRRSLQRAYERPDDEWVYLCEDDYLHVPDTFEVIEDLVDHRENVLRTQPANFRGLPPPSEEDVDLGRRPLVIHPPDYPDRYLPHKRRYSLLFLANRRHWRQISNTTFTFLAEAKTFRRFRTGFDRSATGANDGLLSRTIYGDTDFASRALCVSPIPGLASHMQGKLMSPFMDWETLFRYHLERTAECPGVDRQAAC